MKLTKLQKLKAVADNPDASDSVREMARKKIEELSGVNENNEGLSYLLGGKGKLKQIGSESGKFNHDGLSILKSKEGSYRYIISENGKPLAAIQLMSKDGKNAFVTNAYTDPSYRRTGRGKMIIDFIKKDFENVEFSEDLSVAGKAFVSGVNKKTKGLKALLKDEPKENDMKDTDDLLKKLKDKKASRKTAKKKSSPKSFDLTDVVFLKNSSAEDGDDIFAFFPNDKEGNGKYGGYSHTGQHSPVHINYAFNSELATPKEYGSLLKELENLGYNLEIKKSKNALPGYKGSNAEDADNKKSEPKRVENFRAFEVSYLGATNNNGSRVKIKDLRFKVTKIISYDHSISGGTNEIAIDYLRKKGIEPIGKAEAPDAYLVFTDNFENQIK